MKASLIHLALPISALFAVGSNGWTFSGIFSGYGLSGPTCLDTLMTRYGPLLYKCSMKCGRERYDMENGAHCLIPPSPLDTHLLPTLRALWRPLQTNFRVSRTLPTPQDTSLFV
ncbi:uncharacterized protein LOC144138910 isoform X1 [Haemaphysalis longicornis]